jgi:thioredoxin-dependent peroxiredoxin
MAELVLKLKEGDPAPPFTAPASGGGTISLVELRGKNVVLFFYPKDNTPGCTIEACGIRDHFEDLKKQGVVVLGVSTDSVKSHDKFVQKFQLPYLLVADQDKKIVKAYGVWSRQSFFGIKFMGTSRMTFLIGPDGRIRKIWPKVKPQDHAAEILRAVGDDVRNL